MKHNTLLISQKSQGILSTMSKQTTMIIAAAVGIVIVVGALFLALSKSSNKTQNEPITANQAQQSSPQTTGSIKSIITAGKSQNCQISYPDGSGSGTIFASSGKARADFTVSANGTPAENHMIYDGDYGYFWTGTQGTKFKIDQNATPSPATNQQQSADLNKKVNLNCSDWTVDNSKFEVPKDIKFTDLSETMMMQSSPKTSSSAPTTPQSYCNQLTDPQAKAACANSYGQ